MGTKIQSDQFLSDGWTPVTDTWTYASADDPTYTFTLSAFDATTKYMPGMKIKLTQSTGGTKYAFITKVVFDNPGSTITAYFGTDYNLENEAITAPYYSREKTPFGFPLDPTKWTVITSDTSSRSQESPTDGTWYNLGSISISIPIGVWGVFYKLAIQGAKATSTFYLATTLSTANNSQSDTEFTCYSGGTGDMLRDSHSTRKTLPVSSKTSYYMNSMSAGSSLDSLYNLNHVSTLIIEAVCAYL